MFKKTPLGFFATRKTGEVLSRINDIHAIRQVLSSTGVGVLLDSLMLLSVLKLKLSSQLKKQSQLVSLLTSKTQCR